MSFFRGKEYRDFDEVERGGGVIRYEGRKGETSQDGILITIDEPSGMIDEAGIHVGCRREFCLRAASI